MTRTARSSAGEKMNPIGIKTPTLSLDPEGQPVTFIGSAITTLSAEGGLDAKFASPSAAILVMGAGNVSVTDVSGNTTVIPNCFAGMLLPLRVEEINTSGTTVATPTTSILIIR